MKKKITFIFLILSVTGFLYGTNVPENEAQQFYDAAHKKVLQNPFFIWLLPDGSIVNTGKFGGKKLSLPTANTFTEVPGCYAACYSRSSKGSVYPVGGDIYVMGQIRVSGKYSKRICLPKGYENADISSKKHFKDLCRKIPSCSDGKCWAGGDTGGWFGIQEDGSVELDD